MSKARKIVNELMTSDQVLHRARQIAERLTQIESVRAVVLGGSWARGAGDTNSDIDLGIYYDPTIPLDIEALRALAAELDDSGSGSAVTSMGEWGPWINGGAWLTVNGQRVDWLYRDLALVRQTIEACAAGQPKVYYQPGHPYGFHTQIYLSEIAVCQPLIDSYGAVAALKALAMPYPPEMKRALMAGGLWEAGFALDTSRKSALRGDVFHVVGGLFRCAACLALALHALNQVYWLNEKGAVRAASAFPLRPKDWEAAIRQVLGHPGETPERLSASLERFDGLLADVRVLCERNTAGR
jgi:predicted nucleotidyltransferase